MKKIFISIFVFLTFTFCASARIMVQTEAAGFGPHLEFSYSCFNEDQFFDDAYFFNLFSLGFQTLYEFKTDDLDLPYHIYCGAEFGVKYSGTSFGGIIGFNKKIVDFPKWDLELNTSLEAGQITGIKGGVDFFYQAAVEAVMTKNNRRGLYLGGGLSFFDTPYFAIYKDYGTVYGFNPTLIMKLHCGFRF